MKSLLKIVVLIISIILAVVLGIVIYLSANQSYMSKASAKQLVENRYDGTVKSIHTNQYEAEFNVRMVNKEAEYHIVIDRKKASIKQMTKTKTFKKQTAQKKSQKQKKRTHHISENEAKNIAKKHVGGTFVAIKLQQSKNAPHYAVTQHVNQSEGANVMIHRLTGKVTSVSWFTRAGATTQEEHAATDHPSHDASAPQSHETPNTSQVPSSSQSPTSTSDDDDIGEDDWGEDD